MASGATYFTRGTGSPFLGAGVEWASNIDLFLCAFLSASVLGILLAFFNDEVSWGSLRWSWIATQLLPITPCSSHAVYKDVETALAKAARNKAGSKRALEEFLAALQDGTVMVLLSKWSARGFERLAFYWQALKIKYTAQSRRQFFYQMQKVQLKLEIKPGETEMQSYNDAKRYMKSRDLWPFAYEVSNVKDTQVICEGVRAYPMSSYSYLDFVREPLVQEAALAAGRTWSTGNHGARMLGGNMRILRDLEKMVGRFFGREDSLLCATGFLATMSSICAVAKEGDLIVGDNRLHASLRSGMKLSGAKEMLFRHNNWHHLQQTLAKHRRKYKNCWIVIESVYSMDGDIADLPVVRRLADQYNCRILLDEAHGLGVLGKTGRGLEEHFNMPGAADVIVGTFSKSIGGVGGYITGDNDLVEFLDFHAPGSVFSAPLTAYSAGGAMMAFELMQGEQSWRIAKAQENAKYLRHALQTGLGLWPKDYPAERKFELEGVACTTVIPVVFPHDGDRVFRVTQAMLKRGWMVAAAAYPACPLNRPRIRVTATAAYNQKMMDEFVKSLVEVTVECPPTDMLR
ncbi:putative glycine C-acetyltransferase [Toxoplasma gondii TgCatPRC2]|uniref:serine C-palmitoyltransferase n=15 Tax=Toxoplasma gondii TaxID=5811 RepID=B9PTE5_TOXGV|nr:glycine C-acetyltransferase, putative [Toxoplasma gondii ME49]EPR59825.1 putative glycine C-acetyltransferase [Toxoplasma gondii GT1]ESS33910.1 putative glycine C-acetyltransferase [Toxoplasma gondii VEG]KAF4644539.1 putative glycine C-acetyltransferase [Toxoplasma gondii]KFG31026.1 putative glycine C-acetyltransferase [Toxoplasma gondii p89]KFG41399.1 putative glycine C-acetyltransferase [Toxoplasma gondii FOU]KFG42286.1 putative glycine C-acetyltransferase [Toxoplasma gondii GAB2-2007-GA|eukprot:XP_002368482.1 glycine C-acetyltransferase, putative [Toxoplasma gondii ME49]